MAQTYSNTPAAVEKMFQTLRRLAALEDALGNRHLSRTGSYGAFDQPTAVQAARECLLAIGYDVQGNLKA